MPHYYFDVRGDGSAPDEVGIELSGPIEARAEAARLAGEVLKEADGAFWTTPEWQVHVTDELGATLCTVSIRGSMARP
ncbi:DUF6894 family protein [Rubellimicrobium arenae]|uniref:DUF6894 family protein n=1 Tax=Rubellimicrobium arenae TaxID=2817372 RepID=UPI001B30B24B|nr:hypothetical protein [Rubellimicrobium arenae]